MRAVFLVLIPALALSISALETENFLIIYPDTLERQAEELASVAETVRSSVLEILDSDPGSVTVYLGFAGSYVNGFADPISRGIVILSYPKPSPFLNFESWYPMVLSHELTHVVHLNMRSGLPWLFDTFTGLPLFDAQLRTPFVESTTVFSESSLGLGGRLNNPLLDSLVYYASVGGWLPSLERISSPPMEDFLGYSLYYYIPSRFYAYLMEEYGIEKVKEFLKELSSKPFGIGINGAARDVFGKGLNELWEDWKGSLKRFDIPEVVFEKKDSMVAGLDEDKGKIWLALRRFGKVRIYGSPTVEIGTLEDGNFRKILEVRGYAGNLRVENGKIYYMVYLPWRGCCRFGGLETAVAVWDGKERILVRGLITSFDVKGERLYYAEYDPWSGKSTVHTPDGSFTLDGLVREIAVSKKVAILLIRDGESSVLWIDGKEIHDGRFKYSLKWCGEEVCFIAFDEDGANLCRYTDRMEKLTERLAMMDYVFREGEVLFSGFSPNAPAAGIYRAAVSRKTVGIEKPKKVVFRGEYRRVNGEVAYILSTLKPLIHLPIAFPIGDSWTLGMLLGGVSPDHSLVWGILPVYQNGFDLWGLLDLDLGSVKLEAIRSPIWSGLNLDADVLSLRLSSSSAIGIGYWTVVGDSMEMGVKGWMSSGGLILSWKVGLGSKGPVAGRSAGVGDESGRLTISWDSEEGLSVSVRSSLADVDFGVMDPYFHVSHIFWGLDVFPGRSFAVILGGEVAEFLSYRRSFPWVGFGMKDGKLSVEFGIGM